MVESKFVVLQMIPHTLFIEWDFWTLFTSRFIVHDIVTSVLLFMTLLLAVLLYTSRWHCSLAVVKLLFTYMVLFMYTILFIYMVLFIRPVFFFFNF